LLCAAHNAYTARQVFRERLITEKLAERAARSQAPEPGAPAKPDLFTKVQFALCKMGFRERDVRKALTVLRREPVELEVEPLLRAALSLLTPATTSR
jgi:Holliday junction resolvasome RuvABC DNA-binding subunit